MKRIRRNISPLILSGVGIWMLVNQNASMLILGLAIAVLSVIGIVLAATDKETSKTSKGVHIGLNGIFAAVGGLMAISPAILQNYLKYIMGGFVIIYSLIVLRRMIKNKYRKGFIIAECVPVLLGAALMLVPMGEEIYAPASGGALAATGIITLIGNLFGKKKEEEKRTAHENR
jgi:hypothetical protein